MKEKQNGINRRKRLSPDIEETMDNAVKTCPMGVRLSHKRDKERYKNYIPRMGQ